MPVENAWNTVDHHSAALNESSRKAKHWWDLSVRHHKKCDDCALEVELELLLGCSKWWTMMERYEEHALNTRNSGSKIWRIKKAAEEKARSN